MASPPTENIMTPEDPNHPNYFPEAVKRAGGDCPSSTCSPSFRVFITARQAAGRMMAMPTAKEVTLSREEINALCQTIPALAEFCDAALT